MSGDKLHVHVLDNILAIITRLVSEQFLALGLGKFQSVEINILVRVHCEDC